MQDFDPSRIKKQPPRHKSRTMPDSKDSEPALEVQSLPASVVMPDQVTRLLHPYYTWGVWPFIDGHGRPIYFLHDPVMLADPCSYYFSPSNINGNTCPYEHISHSLEFVNTF